jgi:hypothetical protein
MPTKLWRPGKRSHNNESKQFQKECSLGFKIIYLADNRGRKLDYYIKTTDNLSQIIYLEYYII